MLYILVATKLRTLKTPTNHIKMFFLYKVFKNTFDYKQKVIYIFLKTKTEPTLFLNSVIMTVSLVSALVARVPATSTQIFGRLAQFAITSVRCAAQVTPSALSVALYALQTWEYH